MTIPLVSNTGNYDLWIGRTNQAIGLINQLTDGTLVVNGSIQSTNTSSVIKFPTIDANTLNVSTTANLSGAVNITGTANITGETVISGPVIVDNTLNITGQTNISNAVEVTGVVTVTSTGALDVLGNTVLTTVNVTSSANLTTLHVSGATSLNNNITVSGSYNSTGNITVSNTSITPFIEVSGPPGNYRPYYLSSNLLSRWAVAADPVSETGANTGSNFNIIRYNDAGAIIDVPLVISRATGTTEVEGLTVNSALTVGGQSHFENNLLINQGYTVSGQNTSGSYHGMLWYGNDNNIYTSTGTGGYWTMVNNTATATLLTIDNSGDAVFSGTVTGTAVGTSQYGLAVEANVVNGAGIALLGSTNTATPNKYIRSYGGQLQILNSAYTSDLLILDDSGNVAILGSLNALGGVTSGTLSVTASGSSATIYTDPSTGGYGPDDIVFRTGPSSAYQYTVIDGSGNLHVPIGMSIGGSLEVGASGSGTLTVEGAVTTTGSGTFTDLSTGGVVVNGENNVNGSNIALYGNGSTTPNKFLRAYDGSFFIVDSSYGAAMMSLTDAGNMNVAGTVACQPATASNEAVTYGQMFAPMSAANQVEGNDTTTTAEVTFTTYCPGIVIGIGSKNCSMANATAGDEDVLYINGTQVSTDQTQCSATHFSAIYMANPGTMTVSYTGAYGYAFSVNVLAIFLPNINPAALG